MPIVSAILLIIAWAACLVLVYLLGFTHGYEASEEENDRGTPAPDRRHPFRRAQEDYGNSDTGC